MAPGSGVNRSKGADLVVRYGLSSSALQDAAGHRVTLNAVLRRPDLPERLDLPVRPPGPGGAWRAGRLVVIRLPEDGAARSRARVERQARKHGGTATRKQRRAAGWLALVTTLEAEAYPAERLAALYRLRWQIGFAPVQWTPMTLSRKVFAYAQDTSTLCAGVPAADGRAGPRRARPGRSGARVRAVRAGDPVNDAVIDGFCRPTWPRAEGRRSPRLPTAR
jgi:hypothetical protein